MKKFGVFVQGVPGRNLIVPIDSELAHLLAHFSCPNTQLRTFNTNVFRTAAARSSHLGNDKRAHDGCSLRTAKALP